MVVGTTVWSAAESASACSCGGESTLVAPAGDEHPVGAALLFDSGCGGNLESWSVTVDGAPASLSIVGSFEIDEVGIEPAPPEGAEVVLLQRCADAYDLAPCGEPDDLVERAVFVVGAADTEAPPPASGVVLEHDDAEGDAGCLDAEYDLLLRAVVELDARERGSWAEIVFEDDGEVLATMGRAVPSEGRIEASRNFKGSELEGHELCTTVQIYDASANVSSIERDCTRVEGCACNSSGSPAGAALALLGVVLARSRRYRRRMPTK
ncbi:MAG: hypothetical protein IAG13_14855 [Deltaproteobacteria bacterium]|nr:hypothetical protein [Nannocystaceae bacterium]